MAFFRPDDDQKASGVPWWGRTPLGPVVLSRRLNAMFVDPAARFAAAALAQWQDAAEKVSNAQRLLQELGLPIDGTIPTMSPQDRDNVVTRYKTLNRIFTVRRITSGISKNA